MKELIVKDLNSKQKGCLAINENGLSFSGKKISYSIDLNWLSVEFKCCEYKKQGLFNKTRAMYYFIIDGKEYCYLDIKNEYKESVNLIVPCLEKEKQEAISKRKQEETKKRKSKDIKKEIRKSKIEKENDWKEKFKYQREHQRDLYFQKEPILKVSDVNKYDYLDGDIKVERNDCINTLSDKADDFFDSNITMVDKVENDVSSNDGVIEKNINQEWTDNHLNAFDADYYWFPFYEIKKNIIDNKKIEITNVNFDELSGRDFEFFCADLLSHRGFINVKVTPGSGDQGIDIICEKNGQKYGIQCKCYSKDIGNKAVQEAYAGARFYQCDISVVLTNRYFTPSAKTLAEKLKVELWNRDRILFYIS